ncbi:MAG: peptide MFS transporter [Bacteroidales bacterium]|nr:peptide MFS transporter [Bacteroidales bacterium]MDD2388089.1 peptide MFS transporter [Bacteroidales bacterium]MDD4216810.1 peptide MFS transporter [Bacteroidales bacterium]MDY0140649.1 peptide MFS transporter [Bacteroidales bacterium]
MFKNQPKGLIPAALANMGERFGFYTMMAILTLFLMSKFNLSGEEAGGFYSIFYGAIYILALVGGLIADKLKNYKGTIIVGLLIMIVGYMVLTVPFLITTKYLALAALLVIAFGNGLFKGNLQALVGQLYDNPKYKDMRDSGFQIFYMFINIGGMFAPFAATSVRNWFVKSQGFLYHQDLPALCHSFNDGVMSETVMNGRFTDLATHVSGGSLNTDLGAFATNYLEAFNTGFHYAFSVAIVAMLISLVIFLAYKKILPSPVNAKTKKEDATTTPMYSKEEIQQSAKEVKQRILALFAVFGVVIFFWFSFHQNGLTLTMFAKDYTLLKIGNIQLSAEIFQSINPFIVVFLTPVIMWLFARLKKKGKEPSTPKKIGIGMGIAASAFVIMALGSLGLPKLAEVTAMGGLPDAARVTPWLLFATYFILTVAELFISPLGLSFVSKVAPAHLQGLMQGAWLGATAVGNFSLFMGAMMYESISISVTWTVFVVVCSVSMIAMFAMVKWLDRVAK